MATTGARVVLAALLLLVTLAGAGASGDGEGRVFLILKTGERFATPKKAGPFIQSWADYLARRIPGWEGLSGIITNKPEEAQQLAEEHQPVFGVVSPAFFLEHEEALSLQPILETRRLGFASEQYSLVILRARAKSVPPPNGLLRVATTLLEEETYLRQVVFREESQLPFELQLLGARNLADELEAMIEEDEEAADAVLLDRATLKFFRKDDLVWPDLHVLWTSEECPPDLVVWFGKGTEAEREALGRVLVGMKNDEEGEHICESLQTDGFGPVDEELLESARKWYNQ